MTLTVESLKEQLANSEAEFEQLKATMYRLDGVISLLKHQITETEKPAESSDSAETISEPVSPSRVRKTKHVS